MRCAQCGEELDGAAFCRSCGRDAPSSSPAGALPPPPAPGWNAIPAAGIGQAGAAQAPGHPASAAPGYPPAGYGYGPAAPPGPKPATNLVGAILSTLLCCLPLGVVAIVYAAQVDTKWNAGDWQGAQQASRLARNWANASALVAVGLGLLWVLLAAVSSTSTGGY